MAIVRAKRERNYSVIANDIWKDRQLSWQAMGMLSYILSKPDNWSICAEQLIKVTEGTAKRTAKEGVYNILKELKNAGFIVAQKHATGEVSYTVFDKPVSANPNQAKADKEAPNTANPEQAEPNQAEPTLISTDLITSTESKRSFVEQSTTEPKPSSNASSIKSVIDHLNSQTNSKFQPKGKAAENIKARFEEGFTVDDLKLIIDHKVMEWGKDARMCQYLRPATLFIPKNCAGYLSQARAVRMGQAVESRRDWIPDDESTDWANNLHVSP